ncbi:MAG: DUF4386 domain-containing protein [Candidatus Acidiferrales bacterium]
MNSTKKAARVAGLLYILFSIPGFFSLLYVPSVLIVSGDAAATTHNIMASPLLFRAGIVGNLIGQVGFIFVALALYRLFKGVDQKQAILMVILIVVSIPIALLNELNQIAVLILLSGAKFLSVFEKPQLDALVTFFLTLHGKGFIVPELFWGLWLFPFGVLVYKSRFLPRVLGVWLIVACFAYLADGFIPFFFPTSEHIVSEITQAPMLGEVAMMLWLLIRGAKDQPLDATA